jgi:prepilin-type N-terminal cleavage/methylation domain-containing protein
LRSHRSISKPRASFGARGFSLLELLVALLIVGVLGAITLPAYKSFRARAETATCISHLRTVHSGFSNFLVDRGNWPQMPADAMEFSEDEFFAWWLAVLTPYGVGQESWLCPSDKVAKEKASDSHGSYIPTLFDGRSNTPYLWSQPWLMERGDFHGKGAHIAMPDGSITSSQNPFAGY